VTELFIVNMEAFKTHGGVAPIPTVVRMLSILTINFMMDSY
jgi:hypothetical protein